MPCIPEVQFTFAPKTLPRPAGLVTLNRMSMHIDTMLITDQGTAPRCRLGVGIWASVVQCLREAAGVQDPLQRRRDRSP